MLRRALSAIALLACAGGSLRAQGARSAAELPSAAASPAASPAECHRQTLAVNPLVIPLGWISAEYERVLGLGVAVAVGGSYWRRVSRDDDEYGTANHSREAWVQAKVLYHPEEVTLRGLAVGFTFGLQSSHEDDNYPWNGAGSGSGPRTDNAATVGAVIDYNWLVGRGERVLLGTGIGARRVLRTPDDESPLAPAYLDGRLVLGVAF